ncbi:hypothetical protein AGOR_G00113680 [Albula goreensis]|uniref:Programmed cell death 6-interacting protein n=1 Tax=Albula goreensis TaxID=1534307 RepID=A0A8T3DDD5_9TELE|nr:hypothetical protein AGOR_G00113680 [Albula goreensis]
MATLISVPLKKSVEVDLVTPLTRYITTTYQDGVDQKEHIAAVEDLHKLRKNALGRTLDKNEGSLEILFRYYDQLCAIEPKFPVSDNQVCLTFTWKDAFDKGSLFSGSVKLALASLGYEKTCVLFNVGALASQIAAEQNLDKDEGRKAAAKLYQLASGAFAHIKDTVLSSMSQEPTSDISPDTTNTLSLVMLAQAQEVVFLKASADRMKNASIAKLASQAADMYGEALRQCQSKDNIPKEIHPVLAAKHCIMQAYAEYHQSTLAKQSKRFGEEIARLQYATTLLKTASSRFDEPINVRHFSDKVASALAAAKKDNDFIYHDRVPEVKDLEHIGKATLVKPTPIQVPMSQKFTDLFQTMVPSSVQQALCMYNQRKVETVNRLTNTMREASSLSSGVLASLNLPAALEDLSGDSIPQSILEKSRNIIQQGGVRDVEKLIKDLPSLLQKNRDILDKSLKMLDDEEATDRELKTQFGTRWNRKPSGDLYRPLKTEGTNYRSILDKASQADRTVRERYDIHSQMIALLCKPQAELTAAIPSAKSAQALQGNEVVNDLRGCLAQLEELNREWKRLETDINSANFDMTGTFLSALAQTGAIGEEVTVRQSARQNIWGYNRQVQQSLKTQEDLLAKIQTLHQKFSSMRQSNSASNEREEVLKNLASAYDSYMETSRNLQEGARFYNGLIPILQKFENKCGDIVLARKTERDMLLKEIQQNLQREPSAPSFPLTPTPTATPTPTMTENPSPNTPSGGPSPAPRTVFPLNVPPRPSRRPPPPIPQTASTPPSNTAPPPGYPAFYQMPMVYSPYGYGPYGMPYGSSNQGGYPAPPSQQPHYP